MKVKYVGPFDQIDLPLPNGFVRQVGQGESIELDDEFATGLLDQPDNWQPAGTRRRSASTSEEGD